VLLAAVEIAAGVHQSTQESSGDDRTENKADTIVTVGHYKRLTAARAATPREGRHFKIYARPLDDQPTTQLELLLVPLSIASNAGFALGYEGEVVFDAMKARLWIDKPTVVRVNLRRPIICNEGTLDKRGLYVHNLQSGRKG
jgi:hypothetical protein